MGYKTRVLPVTAVGGVGLELYPTAEDFADNGTNMLGKATTDTLGHAKFDFPRAMDLGPRRARDPRPPGVRQGDGHGS